MTDKIIASLPQKSTAERARIRANCEDKLTNGPPRQQADARKVLDALDALAQSDAATVYDRLTPEQVTDRIEKAFRAHPVSEAEAKTIHALLTNPGATSSTLSAACGWKGQIWHEKFGTMCKRREADPWPAEASETRDANFYSGILADLDPNGNRFTMKPEVAAAFAELGLVARAGGLV